MPELNVKHVPAIPPIASPGPSRTNPLANRRQLTLMIASAIAYVVGAPTVAGFAAETRHYIGTISLFTSDPRAALDILVPAKGRASGSLSAIRVAQLR
jgi:hypothetical protein